MAWVAGVTSTIALFPLETVRTRIAVHHGAYTGIGDCLKQTVAKEGFKGLYQVCLRSKFRPDAGIPVLRYCRRSSRSGDRRHRGMMWHMEPATCWQNHCRRYACTCATRGCQTCAAGKWSVQAIASTRTCGHQSLTAHSGSKQWPRQGRQPLSS